MQFRITGLCVAALALVALLGAAPADEASKKDQDQLQGDWILAKQTRNGEEVPEAKLKASRTVKGNTFTINMETDQGPQTVKAEFKLDASKSPKEMDAEFKSEDGSESRTLKAIYELDGDTMKTCYGSEPGAERPKKFESKEGSGIIISVWKRKKADK